MRRPQVSTEKKESKNHCPSQTPSGALARVRRFFAVSLGGGSRQSPPPSLSTATLKSPCDALPPSGAQVLCKLRLEAESVLGRPLEDLLREEDKDQAHGVPGFVHELCCYMLTNGVDYETLVAGDWCHDRSLLEEVSFVGGLQPQGGLEATAARLFRLFLQEFPHPLLSRDAASALARVSKELEGFDEGGDQELLHQLVMRVRSVLARKVPAANLQFLQYLTAFLHQLRTANHNTCPVTNSALSRLLSRVLTDAGMNEGSDQASFRLAEMLLLNHAVIFRETSLLTQDTSYSSDSVSSTGESRGETTDEADLFTPDDDYDEDTRCAELSGSADLEEDSTTTTTDTDEFRSPPMSPIKRAGSSHPLPGTSSSPARIRQLPGLKATTSALPFDAVSPATPDPKAPSFGVDEGPLFKGGLFSFHGFLKRRPKMVLGANIRRKHKGRKNEGSRDLNPKVLRSTDELPDGGFLSKIGPYGKDYLPSITGLLTAPYDCWDIDTFRSKDDDTLDDLLEPSAESSCVSGEEVSELESEADRDADGSDTEGPVKEEGYPCPHEERRFSERFLQRGHHHSSTGKKPKRKLRRKHSKDHGSRVQSSEEEEREPVSAFASILSQEDAPAPFDPTPHDTLQSFTALLSSNEPVPSDRSSWELRQDDSHADNWQRTIPHYSRDDDVTSIKTASWYRDEDESPDAYRSTKFINSGLSDSLDDGSRPRGHSAIKLLTRNVNAIKRKIKKFEEEFEKSFGYRPSHSDKMKHKEIKKYMSELSKAKKELKQMKGDLPESLKKSFQKPFPISLLRCQESTGSSVSQHPTPDSTLAQLTKETFRQVEECLSVKRSEARRPLKVADLSIDELKEEKTDIQKALLFYESIHGRPSTREDKELVRPLYDRYRLVKRSVTKLSSRPKDSMIELAPILEHVVMDFTLASPQHRGSLKEEEEIEEEEASIADILINPDPYPEVVPSGTTGVNLGDLHALPLQELKERKKEAKEEKKRLRHSLREYEERFERETGRKMQKEDRGPMEKNYNEYKHVKAKLRLLEALLSKHDS